MKMTYLSGLMAAAALFAIAPAASAQTTVSNTGYSVGIAANGELYNSTTGVGFRNTTTGFDPISPGSPRDSWGISTATGAAYADGQYFGSTGLTTTLVGTGATATATSLTSLGLTVTQVYSFATPNILQIATTVTNATAAAISALYQRNVDLDVNASFSLDNISVFGTAPANLVSTTNSGFDNPNPAATFGGACSGASCTRTGDLGGGIRLNLGSIAAGGSTSFNYYYGIGDAGDALAAQATGIGVSYGVLDQSAGRSAFIGVGSPIGAVPEPASWAMMILGMGAVGVSLRRRKSAVLQGAFA